MGRGLVGKGQNGHWAKWKSWARWLLGEMKNGRKWDWAKRQKGRTDIGQNGKRVKLERAKKEWTKREKFGQNGNGWSGIGPTGNKPFLTLDQVTYFLTQHNPFWNSSQISSRQRFLLSFLIIRLKMWPQERIHGYSKIWPSDLVFDPTWPISKHIWDSSRQTFWPVT